MRAITVRNIPDEVHEALKLRAKEHGRSTEAEYRAILEQAVLPQVGLGTALAALGRKYGGISIDAEREKHPVRYVDFSPPTTGEDAAE
jgi:plasmid stability protein